MLYYNGIKITDSEVNDYLRVHLGSCTRTAYKFGESMSTAAGWDGKSVDVSSSYNVCIETAGSFGGVNATITPTSGVGKATVSPSGAWNFNKSCN